MTGLKRTDRLYNQTASDAISTNSTRLTNYCFKIAETQIAPSCFFYLIIDQKKSIRIGNKLNSFII